MPWKPVREVHVTTRAELEAALRSADRIVVDGDASLAAYAALLANGGAFEDPGIAQAARLRPIGEMERAAHAPRTGRPPRVWPWVAGAALLTVGAAFALLREHFSQAPAPLRPGAAVPSMDAMLLVWPALAVMVLLALFFVLRQATGETTHVPAAWRAEAAPGYGGGPGRLTITKVHRRTA